MRIFSKPRDDSKLIELRSMLAGFLSTSLGTAFGFNGPPLAVYLSLRGGSQQQIKAALGAFFIVSGLFIVAATLDDFTVFLRAAVKRFEGGTIPLPPTVLYGELAAPGPQVLGGGVSGPGPQARHEHAGEQQERREPQRGPPRDARPQPHERDEGCEHSGDAGGQW